MKAAHAALAFAREALRAEFMTPAGVVNAIFVFGGFLIVLTSGFTDVVR